MDARMPEMSRNGEIERKILKKGKESVDVFTKMDLVTPANLKQLKEKYSKFELYLYFVVSSLSAISLRDSIDFANYHNVDIRYSLIAFPEVYRIQHNNFLTRQIKMQLSQTNLTDELLRKVSDELASSEFDNSGELVQQLLAADNMRGTNAIDYFNSYNIKIPHVL